MIEQIRERIKAWKRLYAEDCAKIDENSSWREILAELEYYSADKFSASGKLKMCKAIQTIGTFSAEEQKFLETLPAYIITRFYLLYDNYHKEFIDKVGDVEVYCMCLAETEDIPFIEYTIVTDREDLWELEIYIFKTSHHSQYNRHGIIRYAKEPPADFFVPQNDEDLPF